MLVLALLWALAVPASALEARFLSGDAAVRKDGAVSNRLNAESVTEADAVARERRLELLEAKYAEVDNLKAKYEALTAEVQEKDAKYEALAAEVHQRNARKTGHRLLGMITSADATLTYLGSSSSDEDFPGGWSGTNLPPPNTRVPAFEQGILDPRFERGRNNVLGLFTVGLLLIAYWWYCAELQAQHKAEEQMDVLRRQAKDMEHDTYGFALASLIRDFQVSARGDADTELRRSRIISAIGLLAFTFALQLFITLQVKQFVTSKWVYGIRGDYDAYELHMYGEDPAAYTTGAKHPIFPVYAGRRGNPGYFMPGNFVTLDEDLKESICNIPFSQTPFFLCVILIWSLTCIADVRNCISTFRSLILNTKTIDSMKDALQDADPDVANDDPENKWVVDGLTYDVKMVITFVVLLPRMFLVCFLMWLGCRFLAATNDMGEMVLNAVALEFVLLVKDLLYTTVVPDRNKREVEKIQVRPSSPVEFASYWTYLGTFSWGFLGIAWVFYYTFLIQMVLPQYRWDVRPLCLPWLNAKYGPHA